MKIKMEFPKALEDIILRLAEHGYSAHVVGGSVRDFLLGDAPKDYDIATDATPEEVISALSGYRIIETGIKHGTVTVIADGEPYEITTYRIDGKYSDSRHPESVSYTRTLSEDLARRDFTMNALAYSYNSGLVDIYGGEADIKSRIIRTVGRAEQRFFEDALRIMRGLRFSAVLGFDIEDETAAAMMKCRELIKRVSAERIYAELKKLISGDGALNVIRKYREILASPVPTFPDASHIVNESEFLSADFNLRLAALYAASPRESLAKTLAELRADKKTGHFCDELLSVKNAKISTKSEIRRLLFMHGEEIVRALFSLRRILGDSADMALLDDTLHDGVPYRISNLKINGNDIKDLGIKNAEIGKTLSRLLFAVMDGELKNEREELLLFVAKSL